MCKADEIYVTAGEKGTEDEDENRVSADSKKERGYFAGEKSPGLTLLQRSDGRVRLLVCKNPEDVDENIATYGDDSVILCTDEYSIYDGIDDKERVDGHLAVTHTDTYVIGDAHTNTCENCHSLLHQWLAQFRGVSKHHLQKHLDFLALKLNSPENCSRNSYVTMYRDKRTMFFTSNAE